MQKIEVKERCMEKSNSQPNNDKKKEILHGKMKERRTNSRIPEYNVFNGVEKLKIFMMKS